MTRKNVDRYVPRQVTFFPTSQCNARCAHCSMKCGPATRRGELSYDTIASVVDDMRGECNLRVVVFTGGEPMLAREVLYESLAYVASLGIITRIVTNAYWAKTYEAAKRVIGELREVGLVELNISTDDYHVPYVPFDNIVNAFEASRGAGFGAVVIANSSGPRSVINPRYIESRLGVSLDRRYDDAGIQRPMCSPSDDGTVYTISNGKLQRLGRCDEMVPAGDVGCDDCGATLRGGCRWIMRTPAVSSAGKMLACCGFAAEGNAILDMGSVYDASSVELYSNAMKNPIINAISIGGPRVIRKALLLGGRGRRLKKRYASLCEMCYDVIGDRRGVYWLLDHYELVAGAMLFERDVK